MPKHDRPGVGRVELALPADLLATIAAGAAARGESLNTYFVRAAARRAGATYHPPKRGRPPKARPAG